VNPSESVCLFSQCQIVYSLATGSEGNKYRGPDEFSTPLSVRSGLTSQDDGENASDDLWWRSKCRHSVWRGLHCSIFPRKRFYRWYWRCPPKQIWFFLFVVYSQLVKYQQESEFLPDRNAGVDTQYEIDKYDPLVPTCFCNIHKTLVYSQAIWGTLWSFGDTITSWRLLAYINILLLMFCVTTWHTNRALSCSNTLLPPPFPTSSPPFPTSSPPYRHPRCAVESSHTRGFQVKHLNLTRLLSPHLCDII